MATALADWSEHGGELIEAFSGRKRSLIELFNRPLDFAAYKRMKQGAGSRVIDKQPYYFHPDTVGNYIEYFGFIRLRNKYPAAELLNNLVVKTYTYGTEISTYNDPGEELIGVKSKLADPDLELLDLVGKDTTYLSAQFGLHALPGQDLMVKEHEGNLLILHFDRDHSGVTKVDWFNYLKTTLTVHTPESLPDALKQFQENKP